MASNTESSEGLAVFRHDSGAEMAKRAIGYAALHGVVRVESSAHDDSLYLNGYRYERADRPSVQPPPKVSHPWPTMTLSRTDFAEVCDVIDREMSGDTFDYAGVDTGHIYVAYDSNPDSLYRDMDTEERVYAVPEYQTALIEFPISHLSARGTDDGLCRLYGYSPDGPTLAERTISTLRESRSEG